MKKKYESPEAKWISFRLNEAVTTSYTEGGGTIAPWSTGSDEDEGHSLGD